MSDTPVDAPLDLPLTNQQRVVLTAIVNYYVATREPCSFRYLARQLELSPSTVRDHVKALRRKGFLRSSGSPAVPKTVVS